MDLFTNCCNNANSHQYEVLHNPKPLDLTETLLELIEYLLWYLPETTGSFQSALIDDVDMQFIDTTFFQNQVLKKMGLNSLADVSYTKPNEDQVSFYKNNLCKNCQKAIIHVSNETKTRSFLRHLRNSIAHGEFHISDDVGIFFDKNESGNYTAIIKVKISCLNTILKELIK